MTDDGRSQHGTLLTRILLILPLSLALALLLTPVPAWADGNIGIDYLELSNDSRYAERSAYARIQLRSQSRPYPGAEVAVAEAEVIARVIGTGFVLNRQRHEDVDGLVEAVRRRSEEEGVHFFLLDLPADVIAQLASRTRESPALLFNVSAADDALRREQCQPNLLHTLPTDAMQADALIQYLVSRNWRDLMLLSGPSEADRRFSAALEEAARRFGANIAAKRDFEPGNDPRQREKNNIALLTGGASHDVLLVADTEGEFGRYVPYQSRLPRPVAGTTGLEARAWTRVWERHGAPQVNERFRAHSGRAMADADWAAWIAVKAIVQSALRTRSESFSDLVAYLRDDALNLDGAKGPALSFRPWNGQLRQPVLLATHDAVIARAPVEGFLHPENTLDTLGQDEAENGCQKP